MSNSTITIKKLNEYFKLTETALKLAKKRAGLLPTEQGMCEKFIDFCKRYLADARHFKEKGNFVNAFACLNYAHAWLDAAAIAGWLDIKHKDRNRYFTID